MGEEQPRARCRAAAGPRHPDRPSRGLASDVHLDVRSRSRRRAPAGPPRAHRRCAARRRAGTPSRHPCERGRARKSPDAAAPSEGSGVFACASTPERRAFASSVANVPRPSDGAQLQRAQPEAHGRDRMPRHAQQLRPREVHEALEMRAERPHDGAPRARVPPESVRGAVEVVATRSPRVRRPAAGRTRSRARSNRCARAVRRRGRTGELSAAGWTAEHTSWRKPGRVSSAVRTPPPTVSAASRTRTSYPARARATAAASPLGPLPTTVACLAMAPSSHRRFVAPRGLRRAARSSDCASATRHRVCDEAPRVGRCLVADAVSRRAGCGMLRAGWMRGTGGRDDGCHGRRRGHPLAHSSTSSGSAAFSSAIHAFALPSDGARQSPRGDSEPTGDTFGPFGIADRLNCANAK